MNKYGLIFLMLSYTSLLLPVSFLERQYKNVVNDIDLINRCYLKKKSCTAVERAQAPQALARVTAEGVVLLGMVITGVYALFRAVPRGIKITPSFTGPQVVEESHEDTLLTTINNEVNSLFPESAGYLLVSIDKTDKRDEYLITMDVREGSLYGQITDEKGKEKINSIFRNYPSIVGLKVIYNQQRKEYFPEKYLKSN